MNVFNALKYCFGGAKQRLFLRQFAFFALLCGVLGSLWSSFKTKIYEQDVYKIEPNRIVVWNPPEWLPDDFVSQALDNLPRRIRGQELSSVDPQLVANLTLAFRDHPLVEKVRSVLVSYPASVDVVLQFRDPVAFVDPSKKDFNVVLSSLLEKFPNDEFLARVKLESSLDPPSDENLASAKELELFPVDAYGARVPTRYFNERPEKRANYIVLRSFGVNEDYLPRAAELVDFLRQTKAKEEFHVEKIDAFKALGEMEPTFYLETSDRRVVKWGNFNESARERDERRYDATFYKPDAEARRERFQSQLEKLPKLRASRDDAVDLSESSEDASPRNEQ